MRIKTKEQVFSQVYKNFVGSNDYNGLPICNIRVKCSILNLRKCIAELISENRVSLIASEHDGNPHIIRFGFVSKEEQIKYVLESSGWATACLYPCEAELQNRCLSSKPFVRLMELGRPQLMPCYFNWEVLHKYAENPLYDYSFHDYIGCIGGCLRTFGVGRNRDTIVAVACPRDLALMPEKEQNHWFGEMITDVENCKVLREYNQNLFLGSWAFPNTVFAALLLQIENINILTTEIWCTPFFIQKWNKAELKDFDLITMPTLQKYNDYILLLEKVVISNINDRFFNMLSEGEKTNPETKMKYGTLKCLEIFLDKYSIGDKNIIMAPLKKVRIIRQTPAHKIVTNQYDLSYYDYQIRMSKDVWESLYYLKELLKTHPKALKVMASLNKNADNYIDV